MLGIDLHVRELRMGYGYFAANDTEKHANPTVVDTTAAGDPVGSLIYTQSSREKP